MNIDQTTFNAPHKTEGDDAVSFCLAICDETAPLAECIELAQSRMEVQPMFDVFLAKQLPASSNPDSLLEGAKAQRALEILDVISPGTRLVVTLAGLMQSPDHKLRSKAALLLGRRVRNLDWTQRCLREGEPRIRANIIEALWQSDSPAACDIFRDAVEDPEPRVAANAALGLYKARPADGIRSLKRLERQGTPAMQCSALWAMGQTDDQTFFETLRGRLRDDDPAIRGIAFKGLMRLKRNGRAPQAPPPAEESALSAVAL